MPMTGTIYFAHGKESGPWGRKITALAAVARDRGWQVESPDYQFSHDPDERVAHLLSLDPGGSGPLVLVGSSMGGYVSAVASASLKPAGLWLMAPAFGIPGYEADTTPHAGLVEVIHGWGDELIPYHKAIAWSHRHGARLTLLPDGHTLNQQIPALERLFNGFLQELETSS
ncbi:pimeloyl-ACP methyl ester carboxylesterase [Natronocella acetinitrilica]|jgi:hypothetical protein|uniref:Pimeloyl-ACP methyl ester carboxylesterase n=1 Tax=Natronocella acetinitrilica TaxID=414046 RepID=A0AAE3G0M2_9GAMM|nr:alpha/beta hydrolase [Natronocella acetinitrilica]MCP1673245.1 pimeloyl-ACP methyl ester carboxylesterase [Natronocella acetinitrilica]